MKSLAFVVAATVGILILIEIILRISGFRYDTRIAYFQFPFPNDEQLHDVFVPDPNLFWRLKPGYAFGGVLGEVNDLGYRGTAYPPRKPAGVTRIVCIGDSVTFGTEYAYPAFLEEGLRKEMPEEAWEIINAGVPGYTSFQGGRILTSVYLYYEPDIVTINFGWNEHWLSGGYADKDQKLPTGSLAAMQNTLKPLRIYQALTKIIVGVNVANAEGTGSSSGSNAARPVRVSLDDYRENLISIIRNARENGARPILLTSPSGLHRGFVPQYIVALGFMESEAKERPDDTLARLKDLHASYNDIVREVAIEQEVVLLDIESVYRAYIAFGGGPLFDKPEKDIIHPNREGYEIIAMEILELVANTD